jgi:colicin import membrane protein
VSSNGTDLIALETLKPAEVFVPGGVEKIICTVEAVVRAHKFDASTEEGRAEIKSIAYKVARSKTALDDMGKEHVAELKRAAGVVDADRRTIRDRFDALRDEVRKPVDDWEAAEEARINAHVAELETLKNLCQFETPEPCLDEIDARIAEATRLRARDWEEFAERAGDLLEKVSPTLISLRATVVQRNEERAELERLRKAEAERAEAERLQREREEQERIARERQEREERIAREAAEAAERKAEEGKEELRRQVEFNQQEAERRAREVEEQSKRFAEQAERARIEAHEAGLAQLRSFQTVDPARSSERLAAALNSLGDLYDSRDWQEFAEAAANSTPTRATTSTRSFAMPCSARRSSAATTRRGLPSKPARPSASGWPKRLRQRGKAATALREADLKHRKAINNEALEDLLKCFEHGA